MEGFEDAQKQDLQEVGFTNKQITWFESIDLDKDELYINIMYEIFDENKTPQQVFNEYIIENAELGQNAGKRKKRKTQAKRKKQCKKKTMKGKKSKKTKRRKH